MATPGVVYPVPVAACPGEGSGPYVVEGRAPYGSGTWSTGAGPAGGRLRTPRRRGAGGSPVRTQGRVDYGCGPEWAVVKRRFLVPESRAPRVRLPVPERGVQVQLVAPEVRAEPVRVGVGVLEAGREVLLPVVQRAALRVDRLLQPMA